MSLLILLALLPVLVLLLVLVVLYLAARRRAGAPADGGIGRPDIVGVWRSREQARRRRRELGRQRRLPPLPADDAPPPGLVPLVPSPRTVRVEAARGIRELEDWLAEQTAA